MNHPGKWAIVIAVLAVMLFGTLSLAQGNGRNPRKGTKCPWPPCTASCDPAAPALINCLEKKTGEEWLTSFECCCCSENAKGRRYRGLR